MFYPFVLRVGNSKGIETHKSLVEIDNSTEPSSVPKNDEKEKILDLYLKEHSKDAVIKAYDGDRAVYTKTCVPI